MSESRCKTSERTLPNSLALSGETTTSGVATTQCRIAARLWPENYSLPLPRTPVASRGTSNAGRLWLATAIEPGEHIGNHLIPGQDEDGATLVRWLKCVPTDFAAVQRTSSQPSASHANRSSSLENSSLRGGWARYISRSSAAGRALMKRRRRRRSSGDRQSTKGKMSSALRCFGIRLILPDGKAV